MAYPPSPVLRLEAVAGATTRREDVDGDNFPITWAGDGWLYAAYGDGWGCRPIERHTKANTGLVRLRGSPADFTAEEVPCPWFGGGAENPNFKGVGLLSTGGVLYHFLRYQVAGPPGEGRTQVAAQLIWSADHGATWENAGAYVPGVRPTNLFFDEPDHAFHSPTFLQAGQDYRDVEDGFVYVYSPHEPRRRANDHLDLARVPRNRITERGAHSFFAGLDGGERPTWTPDVARRRPVLAFPGHVNCGDVVFSAPLRRYLFVTCGAGEGVMSSLAFCDAPHPWGPWTIAGYVAAWGSGATGDWRYDPRLPAGWLGPDGTPTALLYSDRIPSDKLNVQEVRFRLLAPRR